MEIIDDLTCSICLVTMKNKTIKTLSCGHNFHYECILQLVMRKNFFIKCPLCRTDNKDTKFPHNDCKMNLCEVVSNNTKNGLQRCSCKTLDGRKCKNKAKLLNYGMCHIHNKSFIHENFYPLITEYINLILLQRSGIMTKIFLIDMGKKIIMKYCDENSTISDIFSKYYEFFSIILDDGDTIVKEYKRFYDYYGLELPEKEWLIKCKENYIIF